MQVLLYAWLMWLPVDILIVIGIFWFTRADQKYQAEKRAYLKAEGLYRPELPE